MPSQLHEVLLLLFRNWPTLAPSLLRSALLADVPSYTEAVLDSADLTDVQPAEYRADLVVRLVDGASVFAVIVEVQLSTDEDKRFAWPAYVANLRARLRCPVCLLVVTVSDAMARWSAKPIAMGGTNTFQPFVLGPSSVPEITDADQARENPELAVLSAMAHGRRADSQKSAQIAAAAQMASVELEEDRSKLYFDLIMNALSEAARQVLGSMDLATYEYQSDFARHYVAQGEARGEIRGRATLIVRLLTAKFGALSEETRNQILSLSSVELEVVGERLLGACTLEEALIR